MPKNFKTYRSISSKVERQCKVCGIVKDNTQFGYSLGYVCRKCHNERSKRYNEVHKVEILAKRKLLRVKWRERDTEQKILSNGATLPEKYIPKCYPNYEKPSFVDEERMEIEPTYCVEFGCGRELKLVEKLAGVKCLKHQEPVIMYGYY